MSLAYNQPDIYHHVFNVKNVDILSLYIEAQFNPWAIFLSIKFMWCF